MNQRLLIGIIILAGIGSIGSVMAFSGTISAGQGNFNNVLVTGTCTGCGVSEGDFTTYSLNINKTQSGAVGTGLIVHVGTDKSILASEGNGKTFVFDSTGTFVSKTSAQDPITNPFASGQSLSGKYKFILNSTSSQIDIYKNNAILQRITVDTTNSFNSFGNTAVGISADGKYIGLFGTDKAVTGEQLQVWQGS